MNLIETGHHEVNADGDPDLGSHGVFAGAEEGFDSKVLLDPFEEEFDLPATLVNSCDGQCWEVEVVGQKDQPFSCFCIEVADTPKTFGIVDFSLSGAQPDRLVATQSCVLVDGAGFQDIELRVALGSNHEVCLGLLDSEQAGEVEIAAVDHINTARLESDLIQEMDVVNRSIGNAHKNWDRAGQVELSVQFDGCFGSPEVGPRKHRKTQVDGRGIDSVNHLAEIQPVGVVGIESPGLADEDLRERFVNAPVAILVGIGQIGSGDVPANPHGVEMSATAQTGFDVPKTLPKSDLRKSHREKLIAGGHAPAASLHWMELHTALELLAVQQIENLSKNQTSGIHPLLRMNSANNRQRVQMRDIPFSSLAA